MENQKDITELYQELSYEELTEVLNEWLNPSESSEETTEEETTGSVAAVAAESRILLKMLVLLLMSCLVSK